MSRQREDNFRRFVRRAQEGREDFWLLRWLYPVRRRGSTEATPRPATGSDAGPERRPSAA
jgi:hypothetical protein